ncbi:MAG: ROK family transcriptional regulator [Anaerolineaceae bacterium]|nr:ROK family transcriptional regulator [Anaerolineaceae bacterium]
MKSINKSAILEIIRSQSPTSRTYIAQQLGISLPTVMRIVDELIELGFVRPTEEKEFSGGRRRPLLEFNARENAVVGIDLGGGTMFGAVADIGGNLLYEMEIPFENIPHDEYIHAIVSLIETLLKHPSIQGYKILGIGVGAPGPTLHQEGVVVYSPSLEWDHFPLKQLLSEKFDLPIIVENDINLAALGELWFGAGKGRDNFYVLATGGGIGSALVIDGALYRGAREFAGEIGNLLPDPKFLGTSRGRLGTLETFASGMGLVQQARQALQGQMSDAELQMFTLRDVFMAVRREEPWVLPIFDNTVNYMALAVASVTAIVDPEVIILAGGITQFADLLIPPIQDRLGNLLPTGVHLVQSPLGLRGSVMGAIAKVMYHTAGYYVMKKID